MNDYQKEVANRISRMSTNKHLCETGAAFMHASVAQLYSYNFSWQGRPIIQYPQDIVALQELIWKIKPNLIIETGIAHGGSVIFNASMLALLDMTDAIKTGLPFNPNESKRKVVGIDIDIRLHNRKHIEAHPMASRIKMIQGSSISPGVIAQVNELAANFTCVMVILDSNHAHEHVLAELEAYAPMTSKGSYCVVFDTIVEDLPRGMYPDRPWDKGDNPKTAVWEYKRILFEEGRIAKDGQPLNFEIDKTLENKLLITVAPDGYLKRIT